MLTLARPCYGIRVQWRGNGCRMIALFGGRAVVSCPLPFIL